MIRVKNGYSYSISSLEQILRLSSGQPFNNALIVYRGTAWAGIAAAVFNNNLGVACYCQIMPVVYADWTYTEVEMGIRHATYHGTSNRLRDIPLPLSPIIGNI